MKYPEDFVKRVKAEYPTWELMHTHLDRGNEIVGRYLQDSSDFEMFASDIIKAFAENRSADIFEAAQRSEYRQALYAEWCKLWEAQ